VINKTSLFVLLVVVVSCDFSIYLNALEILSCHGVRRYINGV